MVAVVRGVSIVTVTRYLPATTLRLRVGRTGVLLRSRGVVAGRYRVTVTTLTPRRTATIRGVLRKR